MLRLLKFWILLSLFWMSLKSDFFVKAFGFLFLFLLSAIPFVFHLLVLVPLGGDAPFFFMLGCDSSLDSHSVPILSRLFFLLLPCNLLVFKLVSFVVLFVSSVIVAYTGELFDKRLGWMAGALVFFSVAWVQFHIQIEDDLLAYPLLFLAVYLFIRGDLNKSNFLRGGAVALILFAGSFFWKGALLYLVGLSFLWSPALIILFIVLFNIGFGSMHALLGNSIVGENLNALVAGGLGLGHGIGLFGAYVLVKNYFGLRVRALWWFLPFFVAMLLNVKWALHLSVFLALGLFFLVKDFEENKYRFFKADWVTRNWLSLVLVLVFVMDLGLSVGLLFQFPHANQLEAVQETVSLSLEKGLPISNDWSYGYFIRFFGGVPDNEGGGGLESILHRPSVTLSEQRVTGCIFLKSFGKGFNFDLNLYECG